jgi:hypothetical protein
MLVCGTILVGVFHECTEKFKLAAAVSILHVALAFPVLCGTFAAYRYRPRLIRGGRGDVSWPETTPTYATSNHGCDINTSV